MDIETYPLLLDGLKEYIGSLEKNYGNTVLAYPTIKPTYPCTVFDEIRNIANASYNTCHDRVASVGYRVDVFAKSKGRLTKQDITREIARQVDKYLTSVGLLRVSFNASELENDSSVYHIIMMYSATLFENRRKFI